MKIEFDVRMKAAECEIKAKQAYADSLKIKADYFERACQSLKEAAQFIEWAERAST